MFKGLYRATFIGMYHVKAENRLDIDSFEPKIMQ